MGCIACGKKKGDNESQKNDQERKSKEKEDENIQKKSKIYHESKN